MFVQIVPTFDSQYELWTLLITSLVSINLIITCKVVIQKSGLLRYSYTTLTFGRRQKRL
jgi:hypothetical protein